MATGSITSALSGLLGESSLGGSALGQQRANGGSSVDAVASQADVYTASQTSLLLSNATYTNLGILQGTTAQTGTTGQSRYVDATIGALILQRKMELVQQNSIMSDLNQYGGVNVSGTNYPNDLAPSENEVKANLKRKGDAAIMEKAAQDAKKDQEAAEKDAKENASAEAQSATDGTGTSSDAGGIQGAAADDAAAQTAATPGISDAAATSTTGDTGETTTPASVSGESTAPGGEAGAGDAPEAEIPPDLGPALAAMPKPAGSTAPAGETATDAGPGQERIDVMV